MDLAAVVLIASTSSCFNRSILRPCIGSSLTCHTSSFIVCGYYMTGKAHHWFPALPGSVPGWVQAASGLLPGRATTRVCDTSASLQGLHSEMKMAPSTQSHTTSVPATCPTCTCSILICFRNVLFGVDVLIVAIYLCCVSHQGCPVVSEYINFFWVMPNEKMCPRCELASIVSCVQGAG